MTAQKPNFKHVKHNQEVDDVGNQWPQCAGNKVAEDNAEAGHNHRQKSANIYKKIAYALG